MLIKINWTDNTDGKCWATTSCKIWHLFCSFSDLPSPSSTTAWITMGNTPRSRSKFSFKRKEASRRKQTSLEFVRFCDVWSSHKLLIRSPTADTYVFLFPLVEINFERRHGELLAHPSLVVHSFRHQRRILWAVPAHSMRQRIAVSVQDDGGISLAKGRFIHGSVRHFTRKGTLLMAAIFNTLTSVWNATLIIFFILSSVSMVTGGCYGPTASILVCALRLESHHP